ncbi:putative nucleic acid-binding protein, contains PIN domain [Caldisphaera lagunensis DSM 15908]|uniref:Putative nucleic acid-binding protein, contains PIN domain n=1 Tax=Caldisphaera lagunensis (strain DSM 15908 / JCM 11604 / ANMR 0165 / IC-154) TaxID=1056495 RepID=L0A8W7_CALLD|nr:type II toxin-antitoxin system VapC family toxin [Caldisphaera lagunensis]AFZ69864.1 putative nucleic acid-binding protein, contains PIN domain [Caldisphaera lagunensis DSM 15908]
MKVFIDTPLLVYLNALSEPNNRVPYENLYFDILTNYKCYTDVLVLDELIYVSKRKYNVPYDLTIDFIESEILPYLTILELGEEDYVKAANLMVKYNIKPSDALHLGVMLSNGITLIVSEDKELSKVNEIERKWI